MNLRMKNGLNRKKKNRLMNLPSYLLKRIRRCMMMRRKIWNNYLSSRICCSNNYRTIPMNILILFQCCSWKVPNRCFSDCYRMVQTLFVLKRRMSCFCCCCSVKSQDMKNALTLYCCLPCCYYMKVWCSFLDCCN